MKKECMELFKGEVIKGEVAIFQCHTYNEILALANVTIEQAANEICEILKHIDECEYESDNIALTFRKPDKEDIMESLILYEVSDLMKGTELYCEEDSRTHLYDRITECVKFMRKQKYIEEMVIRHTESFLCEENFDIKIFSVSKYDFSIQVMGEIYDVNNEVADNDWNEIWNEVYRKVVA